MAPKPTTTDPVDQYAMQAAPRLTIAPSVKDATGAEWVHRDYERATQAWEVEDHLPPISLTERFGSVEAWAKYVGDYASPDGPHLLTWSESGLRAVLDYIGADREPGRRTWIAVHPFEQTVQWRRWTELANGRPRGQQDLLEALEDNADDVTDPTAAVIAKLLRTMRGTVSATAESTLNDDGSYAVSWAKNASVKVGADGETTFPNEIKIAIPVFKGHTEPTGDGKTVAVRFGLKIRIRVSPDSSGHLLFRLSMPDREAALEAALENRVDAAHDALGDGYEILRATSNSSVI